MLGEFSAQALGLVLLIMPGLSVVLGFQSAPLRWPIRRPLQTGVVIDAGLFTLASVLLHLPAVLLLLYVDRALSCRVAGWVTTVIGRAPSGRVSCGPLTEIWAALGYTVVIILVAFAIGWALAGLVGRVPVLFRAVYGRLLDTSEGAGWVVANVVTTMTHEGRFVAYEGELAELTLGTRGVVAAVTLAGAKRFLLSIDAARPSTVTTPRTQFVPIDGGTVPSFLTIPGAQISNLMTRTYSWRQAGADT